MSTTFALEPQVYTLFKKTLTFLIFFLTFVITACIIYNCGWHETATQNKMRAISSAGRAPDF